MKEYTFILNSEEFKLTFHDKPRLTKNGISEPVLPNLRRYILAQNLNIQLTDHNGQNKTTNVLSKDFLKYIVENSKSLHFKEAIEKSEKFLQVQDNSIKSATKMENNDNSHFFMPSILNGKTLIIINCCSRKKTGGIKATNEDYFDKNKGEQDRNFSTLRNEIISKNKDQISNPELQLEAYSRYDGSVYREINWNKIIELHNQNKIEVLIVSALYGVIEFQRLIPEYDLTIKETREIWGNTIMEAVNQFVKDKEILNIFNCLSNDYSSLIPEIKATPRSKGSNQKKLGLWINSIADAIR